ncbi:MAG: hypothetical protein ACKOAG_13010 [Candidatus Kapaibacterium sp.]
MHLLLVEDNVHGLYPFSVMHCAWELRCGPERFFEAWTRLLRPESQAWSGRESHVASFNARFPGPLPATSISPILAVRSSLVPSQAVCDTIRATDAPFVRFLLAGTVVALRTPHGVPLAASHLLGDEALPDAPWVDVTVDGMRVTDLHQTLDLVGSSIDASLSRFGPSWSDTGRMFPGVFCLRPDRVHVGADVRIDPCVVLDATDGAIIIDANVHIRSHSVIMGPCFIGSDSRIKAGAKIYANTVIGEWCKVGGEVENSIIHAYSNKQHEGFLGHSHIGEWVNLGADTNTSDLKNTYGPIRITRRSQPVETGRMFLGLLCGDHVKSGIDTMFTTGTVCGIHANVFGAGYAPQEIPSFAWGAIGDERRYPLKKALAVASTVMSRRGRTLHAEEVALMEEEWDAFSR